MSDRYRATVNVMAPLNTSDSRLTEWIEPTFAAVLSKINQHMIVERQSWNPTGSRGLYVLTFTYQAAGDAEAVSIIHDACKQAGASYDAVSVKRRATHGYTVDV